MAVGGVALLGAVWLPGTDSHGDAGVVCVSPGAGMVVDWEQETGLLMSSGDVRIVRIWDTDREMKVQVSTAPRPASQPCSPARQALITEKQE